MTAGEVVSVLGVPYRIVRLLGHGKGGYSYLAEGGGRQVVLKQIHHEPCSYYTFGDKIAAEERDYALLCAAGIRVPKLIALDREAERIVKEYIEGPTASELIEADALPDAAVTGVQRMARLAEAAGLNIDYYPTNFVLSGETLYYVDYECNPYRPEWDYAHWGRKHWK